MDRAHQRKLGLDTIILRHDSLLGDTQEGWTLGKATRRWKCLQMLIDITGKDYMKRGAKDRSGCRQKSYLNSSMYHAFMNKMHSVFGSPCIFHIPVQSAGARVFAIFLSSNCELTHRSL